MKLSKLMLALGASLALILPTGGCSSKDDEKQPKLVGPDNPNAHPRGRGVGGAPKSGGATSQGPISKN